MRIRVEIENRSGGVFSRREEHVLKKAARFAFLAEGVYEDCILNVVLTDGAEIRDINRRFRDTDRETDVLSFPLNELTAGDFNPEVCERDMDSGAIMMGDMVINCERVISQGEEYGHGMIRELAYLTIHSCLHLLGYDHMDEGAEKRKMREREEYIIAKTPYGDIR